jgi:hypothetical protein
MAVAEMMAQTNRIILAALLLIFVLSIGVAGQNDKMLLLIVNTASNAWPDCALRELLVSSLGDHNGLLLASPERSENLMHRLAGRFDKQAVLTEGQSEKYRYVLWCDVVKQQLTIENGFSLPILFTQKRVRASLILEYHIIDCSRGRSVANDRISVHKNGPATLQCIDFTNADPNLLLSYSDKKALFDRTESEAAEKLIAAFDEIARQR